MIDTIPPLPSIPALLISPVTGMATSIWGRDNDLYFNYGFIDQQSGLQGVRAFLSTDTTRPSWDDMPFNLPITGRRYTLQQPLLHGLTYYLHLAAMDKLEWVTHLAPLSFVTDLTPPVCTAIFDAVGGSPAAEYSSTRAGYSAIWKCQDPESDVVVSYWMPYVSGTPMFKVPTTKRSATDDYAGSVGVPLVQGALYHSCVTALNGAGEKSNYTICSRGTYFDGTPPPKAKVTNFGGRLYTPQNEEVCSSWGVLQDPESGLASLEFEILRDGGTPILLLSR